jgi:hypothetical protein
VAPAPAPADIGAKLSDLATDTSNYVRAWSSLLASETRLAGASLLRLVFALLVVPALALGILLSVDALLATSLQHWLQSWVISVAIVLLLNIGCLFGLLVAIRRWWRNLSLPRSRAAFAQMLERMK